MIPSWVKRLPWPEIEEAAKKYSLDPELVGAIIMTESAGNPYAVRFEPNWSYFYNVFIFARNLHITYQTEEILQACSWGLMQVMGSVTRELGFQDELPMLCDIKMNLDYGCKKLMHHTVRYGENEEEHVIAAYNAGSARKTRGGHFENQIYVNKVSKFLNELRALD